MYARWCLGGSSGGNNPRVCCSSPLLLLPPPLAPPFSLSRLHCGNRCHALLAVLSALLALGCLGGGVFGLLERREELARYGLNRAVYRSLAGSVDFEHCHDPAFRGVGYCRQHRELEAHLQAFFGRDSNAGNSLEDRELWTWLGSFVFVFHLSSTVGYAAQGAPATPGGQLAAIAFGIVGIPLFGCALLLASKPLLDAARQSLGAALVVVCGTPSSDRAQLGRLGAALFAVLWFGAALVFALLEGWSYQRAVFFCFFTITTVGIGNDVPASIAGRILCVVYIYVTLSLSIGLIHALARQQADESPLIAFSADGGDSRARSPLHQKLARACCVGVAGLCLCGSIVFPYFERLPELERYDRSRSMFEHLNALAEFNGCDRDIVKDMDLCQNVGWFREHLTGFFGLNTPNSMVDRQHWTSFGSASFTLFVASTIGYGSQSPHTRGGMVVTVVMGTAAVPLFGFCMWVWGSSLRASVQHLVGKVVEIQRFRQSQLWSLAANPLVELSVISLSLWFAGSVAFCVVEDWPYPTSLYFCFVTLTAVGFANVMPHTWLGRALMLVYIAVGLTSIASLMGEIVGRLVASLGVEDDDDPDDHHTQGGGSSTARV